MAASTAFFGTLRSVQSMISTIIAVDTELISLKKVMNQETNFEEMLDSATASAKEFGRTIDGALQSYNSFAKMGFDQSQVQELGKAAMLLSTVGEIEDADASEFLTSTILQFNMAVTESSRIVDSWNEVSNNYAVTSKDLALAITRSGQAADIAKVSFDELNGMVTAIQASTRRGGAQIGNSLKTIFTRLRMSEVETALRDVGIAVYDVTGDFRSATDIFTQLSGKWDDLNSVQKSYIAEQIAGKFHINNFMALMNQMPMAISAANTSLTSAGSATKELGTFQEGLVFKINNLKASFQDMALAVGEHGLTGSFVSVIGILTALADGFGEFTRVTNGWNIKLPIMVVGIYALVKAFIALRASITGVKVSLGVIAIALVALEVIGAALFNATKHVDINTQAFVDNASEIKNNANTLQGLIDKHNELLPLTEGSAEKQQELQVVLKQINDLAPQLVSNTSDYGSALKLNDEVAKKYIVSLREMSKEQLTQAKLANSINLNKAQTEFDKVQKSISKLDDAGKTFDELLKLQDKFGSTSYDGGFENYSKMLNEAKKSGMGVKEMQENLIKPFMRFSFLLSTSNKDLEKYAGLIDQRDTMSANVKGLQEQNTYIDDQIAGRKSLNGVISESDGYLDEETGQWISNTDAKRSAQQVLNDLISDYEDIYKEMEDLNKAQEELDGENNISIGTLESLSARYEDLTEKTGLSKDKIIEFIGAKKAEKIALIADEIAKTDVVITQTEKRISAIQLEINAIDKLNSKKNESLASQMGLNWADPSQGIHTAITGNIVNKEIERRTGLLDEEKKALVELRTQKDFLQYTESTLPDVGKSDSKDKKEKEKKTFDPFVPDEYARSISLVDQSIQKLEFAQSKLTKTSDEYLVGEQKSIDLLNQKQDLAHAEANRLRDINAGLTKQMSKISKSSEEYSKLNEELYRNEDTIIGLQNSWMSWQSTIDSTKQSIEDINKEIYENAVKANEEWLSNVNDIADQVIDAYKDAIDAQIEAEDERHKKRVDNLDDELEKYEEVVNGIIEGIDRQDDADNFNTELAEKQKDQSKLQSKINELALDDSIEAKATRLKLEEELLEKTNEIEKFKKDRQTDLRKEALQDSIEMKKKEIDNVKTAEDKLYDANKKRLENEKNDEIKFAKIREEILAGHLEGIKVQLDTFKTDTTSIFDALGLAIDNSLIKKLEDMKVLLGSINYNDVAAITPDPTKANMPTGDTGGYKYVPKNSNEQEWIGQMIANSEAWSKTTDVNLRKKYADANQKIGIKKLNATYNSVQGRWYKDQLPLYHDGGIVGDKGTPTIEKLHKMLNLGSDERLSVLKLGELVVKNNPIENIMKNIRMPNFDSLNLKNGQNNSSTVNKIEINFGNVIGSKSEAEKFSTTIIKRLTAKGVTI